MSSKPKSLLEKCPAETNQDAVRAVRDSTFKRHALKTRIASGQSRRSKIPRVIVRLHSMTRASNFHSAIVCLFVNSLQQVLDVFEFLLAGDGYFQQLPGVGLAVPQSNQDLIRLIYDASL